MSLAVKVVITLLIITFLALIAVSILQKRMHLMSKRTFLYVFFPLLPLPLFIAMTYVVWPGSTLHLAMRVLIAVAIDGLTMAYIYFFSVPFYKVMVPRFKEYFFEEEKGKNK